MLGLKLRPTPLTSSAQLDSDGTASLEASIAATEAWAEQQTPARWGTEPGAIAFRQAYRDFLDSFASHLKGNKAELDEFTSRLQAALRQFKNNEEELEKVVEQIVTEIGIKSQRGDYRPVEAPMDLLPRPLPPNMRME